MSASPSARSVTVWLAAQGMPCRSMKALATALLPSSRAVAASWPNTGMPRARTASATPATRGTSGPATTRSGRFAAHQAATAAGASRSSATQAPSSARASLPGAETSSTGVGEALSFKARACSRPPAPRSRIFMGASAFQYRPAQPVLRSPGIVPPRFPRACPLQDPLRPPSGRFAPDPWPKPRSLRMLLGIHPPVGSPHRALVQPAAEGTSPTAFPPEAT